MNNERWICACGRSNELAAPNCEGCGVTALEARWLGYCGKRVPTIGEAMSVGPDIWKVLRQDDDCHWYVLPYEKRHEFDEWLKNRRGRSAHLGYENQ